MHLISEFRLVCIKHGQSGRGPTWTTVNTELVVWHLTRNFTPKRFKFDKLKKCLAILNNAENLGAPHPILAWLYPTEYMQT